MMARVCSRVGRCRLISPPMLHTTERRVVCPYDAACRVLPLLMLARNNTTVLQGKTVAPLRTPLHTHKRTLPCLLPHLHVGAVEAAKLAAHKPGAQAAVQQVLVPRRQGGVEPEPHLVRGTHVWVGVGGRGGGVLGVACCRHAISKGAWNQNHTCGASACVCVWWRGMERWEA